MKRSKRGISKKWFPGLKRVGTFPNRMWSYKGKEYKSLRGIVTGEIQRMVEEINKAKSESKLNEENQPIS